MVRLFWHGTSVVGTLVWQTTSSISSLDPGVIIPCIAEGGGVGRVQRLWSCVWELLGCLVMHNT